MSENELTVFAISDFTGKTAETILNSVAIQFDNDRITIKKFSDVSDIDKLAAIIDEAMQVDNILLAYTIVLPELSAYLENEANRLDLPVIDILGPMINSFSQALDQQPQLEVGLSYNIDYEIFEKISCIDFSLRCDDGRNLNKLKEADFVLIGVSRTSKTPLSIYLSQQNYNIATISLSPEVIPPKELYELPSEKIIGLTIEPEYLQKIRENRIKLMAFNQGGDYVSRERIEEELEYAKEIMNKIDARIINITNKAIEDIAGEILNKIK
ncbi:phosphoenolpyruvate synthase regulatory protein [Orenia metallireducens]|uniref:Phosphoenolpyruvate synthase regulatory protein n=1 Tax=Orenia metallireducens TaxID=1413210 RepID=A0A1C0A6R1_9FIRM|nr:phosphoenolpyruvate synthase regulatory protein [Orenia metallireducens]